MGRPSNMTQTIQAGLAAKAASASSSPGKPVHNAPPSSEPAPAPASVAAPIAEPIVEKPASAKPQRFKVWHCGSFQHDRVIYEPGQVLPFSAEEIAAMKLPAGLAVPIED